MIAACRAAIRLPFHGGSAVTETREPLDRINAIRRRDPETLERIAREN